MEREIDWFLRQNRPMPRACIACERTASAYRCASESEAHVTPSPSSAWRASNDLPKLLSALAIFCAPATSSAERSPTR